MADDRSDTGSAAAGGEVHDDDELADILAAELQRYSTGTVPTLPVAPLAVPPSESIQPLATPRAEPRGPQRPPVPEDAFAARVAGLEEALGAPLGGAETPGPSFRRAERPSGRRSAGPVLEPTPAPHTEDLPVVRRRGFVPPPTASELPPAEPLDRVLPTGPVTLPEATASLLESMIEESEAAHPARHAAPPAPPARPTHRRPEPQVGPLPEDPLRATGPLAVPDGLYEDWEQSLRSIGRPTARWQQDEVIVPTGGDPDLATVALPVQPTGPVPSAPPAARPQPAGPVLEPFGAVPPVAEPAAPPLPPEPPVLERPVVAPPEPHGAHALPEVPSEPGVPLDPETAVEQEAPLRRRSGRRRAPVEEQAEAIAAFPQAVPGPHQDADAEGIDDLEVHHPAVSAATTGAIALPAVEPRPRTTPVIIERVRTAILNLPTVPASPTGTGAAAVIGRWFGAFASPLVLVLGFGLVGAGAGAAAAVAVLAGILLAVPALVRSAVWSAGVARDEELQEAAVLGARPGRVVAAVLLVARLGAAAVVLLLAGSTAGAWADRTGALGLGASNAALLGCTAVGLLALLCAALPTRVTAVLVLVAAVLGTVGTLLVALVLAPTGTTAATTSPPGVVAALVAGFVGVGLLLVLFGPDVARWRTDLVNPVSTAVAAVVSAVCGAVLVAAATAIAARLGGGGAATDEFAGALSDASASALAGPLLVVLLVSAVTMPALLLRSTGAAAARLIGEGRPARLGTVAAALLALAGALGLLGAGADPDGVAVAAAAVLGVPVAVWAGVLALPPAPGRTRGTLIGMAAAVVVGLLLADGLLPGATSPVLDVLHVPVASGLRGGPAVGLLVAVVGGALAGLAGRAGATPVRSAAAPADTVDG